MLPFSSEECRLASHKISYKSTVRTTTIPQDVLAYYGATKVGTGPPVLGTRSPRASFDPESAAFGRERGSYQRPFEHP